MKRRWLFYIIIGIMFGVFDFYYHGFISNYPFWEQDVDSSFAGEITWLVLSIGIWLVPIIPNVIYEAKISQSTLLSAIASSLTWCSSIISYYLTNAVQLAFLGLTTRPELHISSHRDPFFWENWNSVFWHDILGGIFEWSALAVVGGFIIGFLVSFIYLQLTKTQKLKNS